MTPTWIPVSERLPADWTDVLLLMADGYMVVGQTFQWARSRWARRRWVDVTDSLDLHPTHWMPLPPPPKAIPVAITPAARRAIDELHGLLLSLEDGDARLISYRLDAGLHQRREGDFIAAPRAVRVDITAHFPQIT